MLHMRFSCPSIIAPWNNGDRRCLSPLSAKMAMAHESCWKVAQRSYRKLNGKNGEGLYIYEIYLLRYHGPKCFVPHGNQFFVEFLDITNYYILPCVFAASWHHSPHTNTPRTNPPVSRGKRTPTTSFHDVEVAAILGCLWFWVWEFPLSSCVLTLLELTIPKPPRPTAKKNAKKQVCVRKWPKQKKKSNIQTFDEHEG